LFLVCALLGGCDKTRTPEDKQGSRDGRSEIKVNVPTAADIRKIAAGLRKGMTVTEVNRLQDRVKPNGVWVGDHSEAGMVVRWHGGSVELELHYDSSAAAPQAKLVSWNVKETSTADEQDARQK
jgi:hypothetical protein